MNEPHLVVGGAVFLWGRGRVSTGSVITAVTLTVHADSVRGGG